VYQGNSRHLEAQVMGASEREQACSNCEERSLDSDLIIIVLTVLLHGVVGAPFRSKHPSDVIPARIFFKLLVIISVALVQNVLDSVGLSGCLLVVKPNGFARSILEYALGHSHRLLILGALHGILGWSCRRVDGVLCTCCANL
jgi:hypothetical protein